MGRKRSFLKETQEKLQESLARPLTSAEVLELDRLIKIQLHGVDVFSNELFSFGKKDIPLKNGLTLRLFSNKPRALYLKGTHAYHAWIVRTETGETIHSIQVTKKPESNAVLSAGSTKVDARFVLESLRELNRRLVRKATSIR